MGVQAENNSLITRAFVGGMEWAKRKISIDAGVGILSSVASASLISALGSELVPTNHISLAIVLAGSAAVYGACKLGPIGADAWSNFKEKVSEVMNAKLAISQVFGSAILGLGVGYGLSWMPSLCSLTSSVGIGIAAGLGTVYAVAEPAQAASQNNANFQQGSLPLFSAPGQGRNGARQVSNFITEERSFEITAKGHVWKVASVAAAFTGLKSEFQEEWNQRVNGTRFSDTIMRDILLAKFKTDVPAMSEFLNIPEGDFDNYHYKGVENLGNVLRSVRADLISWIEAHKRGGQ